MAWRAGMHPRYHSLCEQAHGWCPLAVPCRPRAATTKPRRAATTAAAAPAEKRVVHVLHSPPKGEDPSFHVIFFHGLQLGSYEDAWQHTWETEAVVVDATAGKAVPASKKKVLWPRDWLGQDFSTARICSGSYNSQARNGVMSIDQVGDLLVESICRQEQIGGDGRPVILVGHSMGGLVLKALCVGAARRADQEKACKAFCDNLAGVFFFATPHGGASLAWWARQLFFLTAGPALKTLQVHNVNTTNLNNEYDERFDAKTVLRAGVHELKKFKPLGFGPGAMVVAEGAAKQGVCGSIGLEEDHISICKPSSKKHQSYVVLKTRMAEWVERSKDSAAGTAAAAGTSTNVPVSGVLSVDTDDSRRITRKLRERYTKEVVPVMQYFEQLRDSMKDSDTNWAWQLFFRPPSSDFRVWYNDELDKPRRVLASFWEDVQDYCDPGNPKRELQSEVFFNRKWAGRGRDYRLLMEPVDIANSYYKNQHLESGHYAAGISNEFKDDNHHRPGRFLLLQQQEARVFGEGSVKSSLGTARYLEQQVGSMTWQQFVQANGAAGNT